jgi:predicted AAA+ superfamily ATPase
MYQKRLLDDLIAEYLEDFPAILIEGAKAIGKTSTCSQLSNTEFKLDSAETREILAATPEIILSDERPVLLDEWQRMPSIWDFVRRFVDDGLSEGSVLLTGSSPNMYSNLHSGSGRVIRLKMRPYSIEERRIDNIKIRLSDFLRGRIPTEVREKTDIGLVDYVNEIFKSGFPGLRNKSERAINRAIKSYVENITEHDFKENNIVIRKPQTLMAWLRAYAAAAATTTAYKTIARAAISGDNHPTEKTAGNYREVLSSIGVVEELPAWLPMGKIFNNLGRVAKHFVVDPSLIVSLLNIDKETVCGGKAKSQIGNLNKTFIGQLFESLIYQSLATYAQVNEAEISHFRLNSGTREIDFIIQKQRTIVAVEVKSSTTVDDADVAHLSWLEKEVKDEFNVHKILLNMGSRAYIRKDGVFVVPAAMFGA